MLALVNKELKPFEALASDFAAKELAQNTEQHDNYPFGPFFDNVLERAWEVGFLGITLPEKLGGIGQGISTLCVILDHICRADSSLGGIIFSNTFAQELILCAQGDDLLAKPLANAENAHDFLLAAPPYCNPAETELIPIARKEKKSYILNGPVEYVVMAEMAGCGIIPARIEAQEDYSYFLINLTDKGVLKSEPIVSLGLHACPACDLNLKEVKADLIGMQAHGSQYFSAISDKLHVAAAAMSLGIMKGTFREASAYSRQRRQGGREIINWTEMRMILANMAIRIKNAEMCVTQASLAVDRKDPQWELCSMAAALHVQEMACDITTDGIQVLGGNGYMTDYGQEKRYRDAKQVQALLGITPLKKLEYMNRIKG